LSGFGDARLTSSYATDHGQPPDGAEAKMSGRLALMVTIWPADAESSGVVRVADGDSQQPLRLERGSFVLTLEHEPDASYARGHLRCTSDGSDYAIQTTTRLFDALQAYMTQAL
jgi:hypothetical protein